MRTRTVVFAHHFPLSRITGVTVTLDDLLRQFERIDDLATAYVSYDGCSTPADLTARLTELPTDAGALFGVNLQIEVGWDFTIALMEWCKRAKIPAFIYVYDYWPHHHDTTAYLVSQYGARLLAPTSFIQSVLADAGFDAELVTAGVPFLDSTVAPPLKRSEPKLIASIGRLAARKRLHDVVRAFALADVGATAQLYLKLLPSQTFGSSDDAEQLELIEREIRRGNVPAGSIRIDREPSDSQDYGAFAIYVSASSYEGFGLPGIQSAYAGCVPLLSAIPPHRATAEALFAERAPDFLFAAGDHAALAALLRDEVDTGRRSAFILEHIEEIRAAIDSRWSMKAMADAIAALLP
jgi:glycosyltransferase involved in cell wall biosynthesis